MDVVRMTSALDQQRFQNTASAITGAYDMASGAIQQVSNIYGQVSNAALNFEQQRLDTLRQAEAFTIQRKAQDVEIELANKKLDLDVKQFDQAKANADRDYELRKLSIEADTRKNDAMTKWYQEKAATAGDNDGAYKAITAQRGLYESQRKSIESRIRFDQTRIQNIDKALETSWIYSPEDINAKKAEREALSKRLEIANLELIDFSDKVESLSVIADDLNIGNITPEDAKKLIDSHKGLKGDINRNINAPSAPLEPAGPSGSITMPSPGGMSSPPGITPPGGLGDAAAAVNPSPTVPSTKRNYADTKLAVSQMIAKVGPQAIGMVPEYIARNSSDEAKKQLEAERMNIAAEYVSSRFTPDVVPEDQVKFFTDNAEALKRQYAEAGGNPADFARFDKEVIFNKTGIRALKGAQDQQRAAVDTVTNKIIGSVFGVEKKTAVNTGAATGAIVGMDGIVKKESGPSVEINSEFLSSTDNFLKKTPSKREKKEEAELVNKQKRYELFRNEDLENGKLTTNSNAYNRLVKMDPSNYGVKIYNEFGLKRNKEDIDRDANNVIRGLLAKGEKAVFDFFYELEKHRKSGLGDETFEYEDAPDSLGLNVGF